MMINQKYDVVFSDIEQKISLVKSSDKLLARLRQFHPERDKSGADDVKVKENK